MREIMRTNDPALISFVESVLKEGNVNYMVADQNISILEGSIGVFPRRILVTPDHEEIARDLLNDAEIGDSLLPEITSN